MTSSGLPPRSRLKAVLLDAGGVLVNPDWERVVRVLALHDIDVDPRRLDAAEALAKHRLDRGETMAGTTDASRTATYFGLVLSRAGFTAPVPAAAWEALKAEHARLNLWRVVLPGVPAALSRLRAAGLRLAVVSNANGTVHALFTDLGLASSFDLLLDSFVEGVEKPDPEIFRRALQRLGIEADQALHVGDFYHLDVTGSRAAGLEAALIDRGGLYAGFDCPRFPSLPAFVDALLA